MKIRAKAIIAQRLTIWREQHMDRITAAIISEQDNDWVILTRNQRLACTRRNEIQSVLARVIHQGINRLRCYDILL